MVRPLRFEDLARRRLEGMLEIGQVAVDPADGASVFALRTDEDGSAALVRFDPTSPEPVVVVGPAEDGAATRADELAAQRQRRAWSGVGAFRFVGHGRLAVSRGGFWSIVDRDGAAVDGYDLEGALAVATSEASPLVAATSGREVWVTGDGRRRRLTLSEELSVGVAEYVAQEEFGRYDGLWLSPSGRWVAWTVVDERHVREHVIVHHEVFPEEVERFRYPFVGDANARVVIEVADLEEGAHVAVPLEIDDGYLVEAAWINEEALLVGVLDRAQHELVRWRLVGPDFEPVRFDREHRVPWVEVPGFLAAHEGAVITRTQRFDGAWRLVRLDGHEARLLAPDVYVTGWVGSAGETAVVVGYRDDPTRRSLFRVAIDQARVEELVTGGVIQGAAVGDKVVVAVRSSRECAPELLRLGGDREVLARSAVEVELAPPRLERIEWADGLARYAAIYAPEDGTRGAPLVLSVYGGPHVQLVQDAFTLTADLTSQWLSRLGAVVLKVDGRGSSGRGRGFEDPIAEGFGTVEVEDHLAVIDWAERTLGIDASRVGVYGWSYGGYLTLLLTSRYPERFRVGVAGAPVVDFRWYDTGYSERYLGQAGDPRYDHADVMRGLEGLSRPGAPRVMVIHGMVDENVHVGHTLRLLARAEELGLDLEFVALPSSRHGPRSEAALAAVARRRVGFLATHLGLATGG